ncbi:MAG: hypothetical protein AAF485_25995, partial [Chloroflexota bacterium]
SIPAAATPTESPTATKIYTPTSSPLPTKTVTPTPIDIHQQAVQAICPYPETATWAGPWLVEQKAYKAAITWQADAAQACLALFEVEDPASLTLVAHRTIEAGFSERYQEVSSPTIVAELLDFPGGRPFFVTTRLAEGHGGGGGNLYTIWHPQGGNLIPTLTFSLESYTNINAVVETPCDVTTSFSIQNNDELHIDSCFDGEPQARQVYHFDGAHFHLEPKISTLEIV